MRKLTPTQRKQRKFQQQSRNNNQLIYAFCQEVVHALGYRTTKDKQQSIVYWLDSQGKLNHLLVRYQLRPDSYLDTTPWIVRIFINHYEVIIPQSSLRELLGGDYYDLRDRYPTARTRGRNCSFALPKYHWSFELSLFPNQLKKAISWIVHFVHNKDQGLFDERVVPPFACRWWSGYSDHCHYAWSEDAHVAYEAWNEPRIRERERLQALRKSRMQSSTSIPYSPDKPLLQENEHVQ